MLGLVVVAAVVLAVSVASRWLGRYSVTGPIVLVLAGAALAAGSDPLFAENRQAPGVHQLIELTLAVVLFTDATEIRARWLRSEAASTARLLGIGLPLALAAGIGSGLLVFSDLDPWLVALVVVALTPTDAALVAAAIDDERIPVRLRRLVNVESGLNDGLVTPVFAVVLAVVVAESQHEGAEYGLGEGLLELLVGVATGLVVGVLGARLVQTARRHGWSTTASEQIAVLMLPALTYGLAILLGGNGFVAAFVAGIAVASAAPALSGSATSLSREVGVMLGSVIWFLFGSVLPGVWSDGISWRSVLFAVLLFTVARMLPVAVALLGAGLRRREVAVIGWFGPRGLASVLFGLLALEEVTGAEAGFVAEVVAVTVLLSIVLHGLSAGPIAASFGRGTGSGEPAVGAARRP